MFGLFGRKNPYEQAAGKVYAAIAARLRRPEFYTDYGVADTQEGRFDLLLVHLFIVMRAAMEVMEDHRDFNQALFDAAFADMDQTLREIGIGDTGVPKRMRHMMKAFNGRMHAYRADVETALVRNLYGGRAVPSHLAAMKNYVQDSIDLIKNRPVSALRAGRAVFAELEGPPRDAQEKRRSARG